MVAAWVRHHVTCGMSSTLHSQCLVVFPMGFSSTVRRVQNCSDSVWDCVIRPKMAWPDVVLGDIKHGFAFASLEPHFSQ